MIVLTLNFFLDKVTPFSAHLYKYLSIFCSRSSGDADANKFTVYADGKSYLFTVTGKGKEWADQFISAVTANPGGIMSIVQNSTGVKVTDIVVA